MSSTQTTKWTIDPTHAEVGFSVRHMMIATVRGRFGAVSGTATVDEHNPKNSKVDVTIDARSVDTRQEMRDNHLRSPDFFDVEQFPNLHFVSKRIDGDPRKGEFRLIGDLTIRGVTREVELKAALEGEGKDPWGNERAGFSASGKLNRTDFGLHWNQALEAGGVLVSDEVKLAIDVEMVKQADVAETVAA
ncbi:MAG TPA: YceI family protein [Gemmatimonadaceae bacterium]